MRGRSTAALPSTGIVIKKVASLERGLFAAPSLLQTFGKPRSMEDLVRLPLLTGPNDAPWALTTPAGVTAHLPIQNARLISPNADIRLQAALAGHGVLRVTASYTGSAVAAGLLQPVLPDHVCEPLKCMPCCRRGNSFPPGCDVSWMRSKPTAEMTAAMMPAMARWCRPAARTHDR